MRLFGALFLAACGAPTPVPSDVAPAEDIATVSTPSALGLSPEELLEKTTAFHAGRPRYERPLGVGGPVEGLADLSAATCGTCHRAIYEEWRVSTHAHAWVDPQFQAEITKSGNRWLCLNCHTPLLVQHDTWPIGLTDGDVERPVLVSNPGFQDALREEGITCASCHVRDGAIVGPGLGGEAPHPVVVDTSLRGPEPCLRCHQAVATYPGKSFVCVFETGDEWEAGPYPAEGKACSDCHMPAVERPAAAGGPVRTVRRHWWRGAGIPKVAGVHPPREANPPGLGLAAEQRDGMLRVVASNARAGHALPSGDPERWIVVRAVFEAGGTPVGAPWETRFGQVWSWHPVPERRSDNRLLPREERVFSVPIPETATAVTLTAESHRMSEENAAYHGLTDYPLSIETHRLERTLTPRSSPPGRP